MLRFFVGILSAIYRLIAGFNRLWINRSFGFGGFFCVNGRGRLDGLVWLRLLAELFWIGRLILRQESGCYGIGGHEFGDVPVQVHDSFFVEVRLVGVLYQLAFAILNASAK